MTAPSAARRPSRPVPESALPPLMDWGLVECVLRSENVRSIYLWGPPGIGKTFAAYHVGRVEPVYAVTLTEDTPVAELRGHYLPVGKEMVWHDGPFTAAMREGARLVVNELTHGTAEVLSLLLPVLEQVETARLTLPTNETVRPRPGFQVICTDNAPPDDLPPALRDRFDCLLEVREPHPTALEKLDEPLRRAALRTFGLEADRRISLRGWFSVQRLQREFGLRAACQAAFGSNRGAQIHDAIVLGKAAN